MDSYDTILQRMKDNFKELAGYDADDASDIGIKIKLLAGEIFSAGANVDWLKNQMFPETATGIQLDYHGEQRGLTRKTAICATGEVTFSINTSSNNDISIPSGTVVATNGINPIRFVTTKDAVIASGTVGINVPIIAADGGVSGNVAASTITVMVTPPTGVNSVNNSSPTAGGTDAEDDYDFRKRVLNSYQNISNGSNIAYYKEEAMKISGVFSAGVVPRARGVGTVDVYICEKGQEASSDLVAQVQQYLSSQREVNVDVRVFSAKGINISVVVTIKEKTGYDSATVISDCEAALSEYAKTVGIGETIYLSDLGDVLHQVDGVAHYTFYTEYMQNIVLDSTTFPMLVSVQAIEEGASS
ncbi:MAG: baseplate J/gp47 family protein [Bacillota bacterium]|nr:baseplate J/gp47 family protein [Bacillota bacterium]